MASTVYKPGSRLFKCKVSLRTCGHVVKVPLKAASLLASRDKEYISTPDAYKSAPDLKLLSCHAVLLIAIAATGIALAVLAGNTLLMSTATPTSIMERTPCADAP